MENLTHTEKKYTGLLGGGMKLNFGGNLSSPHIM